MVCFKASRVRKFRVKAEIPSWHFLSDVYTFIENVHYSAAAAARYHLSICKFWRKTLPSPLPSPPRKQQGVLESILDCESKDLDSDTISVT